jgi:S-adenosylmethionine:tRNA ribosyltransferase-isomerase
MKTDLFDFPLPDHLIALRPAVPRDSARLMVVGPQGGIEHRRVRDLPQLLGKCDILSINDSKVIPARLTGIRPPRLPDGPPVLIELTLHKREGESRYRAFVQPARRLRPGDVLDLSEGLEAEIVDRSGAEVMLEFNQAGAGLDAAIGRVGSMPLPPYIAKIRIPDVQDRTDYQTVYAGPPGSVAAPTAGLHFTPELLDALAAMGIETVRTTLHVGAGTFLPVSTEDTGSHRMHAERALLTAEAASRLNAARAAGGRVVAVGTTALRILESAADAQGQLHAFDQDTDIFITPGYRFRVVNVLLTNFHLPRSTLFMLVSAFMGREVMQAAYAEAIREEYRFYSYGDACLLFRPA